MNPVTTEEIDSLAEWDTPALSNALDSLRLRAHNVEKAESIRQEEQSVVGWSRSDQFTVDGLLALRRVRH
jgi:hypothetical protein